MLAAVQQTLAQLERQRGSAAAQNLESQAATKADTIRNFATQWAAQIESQGNEEADRFYREMQKDSELAILLAWRDTLRDSLTGNTTFITDTTRAPFHLLDLDAPTNENGLPLPQSDYEKPVAAGEASDESGSDSEKPTKQASAADGV